MQPADLGPQLAPVARPRQGQMADVELEVEVGVVDPVGPIEIERNPQQLVAQRRDQRQARLELRHDLLEARRTSGRTGRVVHAEHAEMVRRAR